MKASRLCFVALLLALWPGVASAGVSCAEFMKRMAEAPPDYEGHYPVPKFELKWRDDYGHENWAVLGFDDVSGPSLACKRGDFWEVDFTGKTAATAPGKTADDIPSLIESPANEHLLVMARVALHALSGDWQVAENASNSLYQGLRVNPYRPIDTKDDYWGWRVSLLVNIGNQLDFDLEDLRATR
jgi:hypothetical protein